jgi:hypothetical protein
MPRLQAGALVALTLALACTPEGERDTVDRSGPPCDPPSVWPALPAVEAIAARPVYDRDSGASASPVPAADPGVVVPQYAFLRDADRSRCDPVIVVEAGRDHVVYWGVDLTSNGIAPRERVELLGTDRAAARR